KDAGNLQLAGDTQATHAIGRQAGDLQTAEIDFAAQSRELAAHDVEHRGLAGAVRADDAENPGLVEVDRELVENGDFADMHAHAVERQFRRRRRGGGAGRGGGRAAAPPGAATPARSRLRAGKRRSSGSANPEMPRGKTRTMAMKKSAISTSQNGKVSRNCAVSEPT